MLIGNPAAIIDSEVKNMRQLRTQSLGNPDPQARIQRQPYGFKSANDQENKADLRNTTVRNESGNTG